MEIHGLLLLHGENTLASRQELVRLKKGFVGEVVRLESQGLELAHLIQTLEAESLFGGERLVVLENLFASGKPRIELVHYLKRVKSDNLIIWEGRELKSFQIKLLGLRAKEVRIFKTPAVIFKFVDSIAPGNKKNSLSYLEEALKTEEEGFVFHMLLRQLRLLLLIKDLLKKEASNVVLNEDKTGPSEMRSLANWQKAKLIRQAKKFNLKELKDIYKKLLEIEMKIRTGKSLLGLGAEMERLMLSL